MAEKENSNTRKIPLSGITGLHLFWRWMYPSTKHGYEVHGAALRAARVLINNVGYQSMERLEWPC